MNVRSVRHATWMALPALAFATRRAPRFAGVVTALLTLTIGVGHGAKDDRILHALRPASPGGRRAIQAAYGALALAAYGVARRYPRLASVALEGLGWYHFGTGDVAFARACGSTAAGALGAVVRGSLTRIAPGSRAQLELGGAVAYAISLAARGRGLDALDVAIPAAALAYAPAPHGAAAYFAAWHAPRHVALLVRSDPHGGTAFERLRRLGGEIAANTILSLAVGGAAFALSRKEDRAEIAVAAILAITVPHEITISLAARARRAE